MDISVGHSLSADVSAIRRDIWAVCNLLRGPYKKNEYRKVILPFTVLRRLECVLVDTKDEVLRVNDEYAKEDKGTREKLLLRAAKQQFYNVSKFDFATLLHEPRDIAPNFRDYLRGFSPEVQEIMRCFDIGKHVARLSDKKLLFEVTQKFASLDLSPSAVGDIQMGYLFEELIRIGAEQSNEEAGEHFTPREVIRLMVSLLLADETDTHQPNVVKTVYDPACGTGGMLSITEDYLRQHYDTPQPKLYGQELNDESWAICRSNMLIKGDNADNIVLGDSFTKDGFQKRPNGDPWTYDYMLANPPYGVEWKAQKGFIHDEHDRKGHEGRFGAGLPSIKDGSFLFLQHMLSKMQSVEDGGSRIAIVFNGSPLFTGGADSGPSNIRKWIIENDWLEAIVALPDQLFYNTAISTYIWILTNRKEDRRKGKVQLIDGREFYSKMDKAVGNKRKELSEGQIADLTRIHSNFVDGETRDLVDEDPVTHEPRTRSRTISKVLDNDDCGYNEIVVKRPLRLNFAATEDRIARLWEQKAIAKLVGQPRREAIYDVMGTLLELTGRKIVKNREEFVSHIQMAAQEHKIKLSAAERKAILTALSERDPNADICKDNKGNTESDTSLSDTEIVPLSENIDAYMEREVLLHVPDAWIDDIETGYEIPFNRHFYVYESPRPLKIIEADLKTLEAEIADLLAEVTA